MGPAGQFVRLLLLVAHSRLQLLPRQRAGRREYGELGPGYLGRRAGYRIGVVRGAGEEGLQGPSGIRRGGQEGRNGVADGMRCRTRPTCFWRQSGYEKRLNENVVANTRAGKIFEEPFSICYRLFSGVDHRLLLPVIQGDGLHHHFFGIFPRFLQPQILGHRES